MLLSGALAHLVVLGREVLARSKGMEKDGLWSDLVAAVVIRRLT